MYAARTADVLKHGTVARVGLSAEGRQQVACTRQLLVSVQLNSNYAVAGVLAAYSGLCMRRLALLAGKQLWD